MKAKLKTNKAMAKRVKKISKKGKVIHRKAWISHLLTNKNNAHKKLPYGKKLAKSEEHKVKYLLPYNK